MHNQELYNRIRQAYSDPEVRLCMLERARQMVRGLHSDIDSHTLKRIASGVLGVIDGDPDEARAARTVNTLLARELGALGAPIIDRSGYVASLVRPYLRGRVLDFGCGDGLVSKVLSLTSSDVLYDVIDYRDERAKALPFTVCREDLNKRTFDTALVLTVLHHTQDPDTELAWLTARARRLVVIESVVSDLNAWSVQAFVDWFYNRGMHPGADIPVPGSFRTTQAWRNTFIQHGFTVAHERDLGIDIEIVPEHHVLFVLDR